MLPPLFPYASLREHLRRFRIGTVDEDERRIAVRQCETAELLHVELAMRVVADDT
jgi:hypothetical protein